MLLVGLGLKALALSLISQQNKRTKELGAIAQKLNLKLFPKGDDSIQSSLVDLGLFARGRDHQIQNLMLGQVSQQGTELSIAIFDHIYTTGNPDDPTTVYQTVLSFYNPDLEVPGFRLQPRNPFDTVSKRMGYGAIAFEDTTTFSERYRLYAADEMAARSLFQRNLLYFFRDQKITVEAKNSYILVIPVPHYNPSAITVYKKGIPTISKSQLIPPEEMKAFLYVGLRLMALLSSNAAYADMQAS